MTQNGNRMTSIEKVAEANSWFELYAAMCALDDQQVERAIAILPHGSIKQLLLELCQMNGGCRVAGWLLLTDQGPTVGLLDDAMLRTSGSAEAASPETLRAAFQLIVELGGSSAAITREASLEAARFGVRFASRYSPAPIRSCLTLARHALESALDKGEKADASNLLSISYQLIFSETGDRNALQDSVFHGRRVLEIAPPDDPERSTYLNNLANRIAARYEAEGGLDDLDEAVVLSKKAVDLTAETDAQHPLWLSNLAERLAARYHALGDRTDLDAAIASAHSAFELVPEASPEFPSLLANLAAHLETRFVAERRSSDIDMAIALTQSAVDLSGTHSKDRHRSLNNLAALLGRRYELSGNPEDLDQSIGSIERVLALTGLEEALYHAALGNLADQLAQRAVDSQGTVDIERAVVVGREVVEATSADSAHYVGRLASLAKSLFHRYELCEQADDLDASIRVSRQALAAGRPFSPSRPGILLDQLQALWVAGDDAAAQGVVDEWCELVEAGAGVFNSVFTNAKWLAASLNSRNDYLRAARVGRTALQRADDYPGHATRSADIRASLDGVAAETAFALVRDGLPKDAAQVLESVSGVLARRQALSVDRAIADKVAAPEMRVAQSLQHYLDERRRIDEPSKDVLEEIVEVEAVLAEVMSQLRAALGMPQALTATAEQLESAKGSHTWLFATARGGAFVHRFESTWTSGELPNLTTQQVDAWQSQLRPNMPSATERTSAVRGPEGGQIPTPKVVAAVCAELNLVILDHLPQVVWTAVNPSDAIDWLIPFGVTQLLPWQARHPDLRLHLSASNTLRIGEKQEDAPLIVLADPERNLPGALREGDDLGALGALTFVGTDATVAHLHELSDRPVRNRLHFAAHGNSTPGIDLADQPLDITNAHTIGPLLGACDHLTVNACTSGAHAAGHSEDSLSLAAIAHTWGTRVTTVALWPLDDAHARAWALHHHHGAPAPDHAPTTHAYQTYG